MNIFNIEEQFDDLFVVNENKTKQVVKNPLNILWLLENNSVILNSNEKEIINKYIQQLQIKIPNLNKNAIRTVKNTTLVKVLLNEENLLKRMQNLITQGANIKDRLNKIIDYKSIVLIEESLKFTDINHVIQQDKKIYYPIKMALTTRSTKIAKLIYEAKELDKEVLDESNHNLAYLAAKYQQLEVLNDILKNRPHSLYEKGLDNLSAIDVLFSKKNLEVSKKTLNLYKLITFKILDLDKNKKYLLEDNIKELINNHLSFKDFLVEYNYLNLNSDLSNNDINKKRLKI